VYGTMEGFDPNQVITAKLPPAHVADEWIRPGEWHPFAVRNRAMRYFGKDGKRTNSH
jgi:multiple sugar transport system ATP-binding protein